ncbi:hypothetical protein ABIA69_004003 [Lysinibacillus parviboronicapiens]|uniref:Uncharacterized protein n=1 Tax=Lysinibacillus parviboronicapiens TaxID=436516 RepID=A0ABV2PPE0_9BACI
MQARHFRPRNVIVITIIVSLSLLTGHAIYTNFIEVHSNDITTDKKSGVFIGEISTPLSPSNPDEV